MNNISSMNLGCKDRLTTVGSSLPDARHEKEALRGNRRAFYIKYSQYHRQRKCLTFHGRLKKVLRVRSG
jgi:hypothetical protein